MPAKGQDASPLHDTPGLRQPLATGDPRHGQYRFCSVTQGDDRPLAVFEEEQWPSRIDDPLPQQNGQDPKRRLHDTINSLNRKQKNGLIRFSGDGRGAGVRWKLVARDEGSNHSGSNGNGAGPDG